MLASRRVEGGLRVVAASNVEAFREDTPTDPLEGVGFSDLLRRRTRAQLVRPPL
jgi:hypothetical protein